MKLTFALVCTVYVLYHSYNNNNNNYVGTLVKRDKSDKNFITAYK